MKIGVNWKRKGDKIRFFDMEFNSLVGLANWLDTFFEKDMCNEIIELKIWKI